MPRRRKNAQVNAKGCKICGRPDVGRGIARHVKGEHGVDYDQYTRCFSGEGMVIVDKLEKTGTAGKQSKTVLLHVLVRRFTVSAAR